MISNQFLAFGHIQTCISYNSDNAVRPLGGSIPSGFSYVKAAPVRTEQCIASHNAKLAEGRYACAHDTTLWRLTRCLWPLDCASLPSADLPITMWRIVCALITQLACLPARFLSHDVCIWSIEAQSSSWQAVRDKVHPQQLYWVQCLWHAQQGCKEDGDHFTNVGRHHVADELHPQPEVSLQTFMIRNSVPGANESGLINKGGLKTATIPLLFHHAVGVLHPQAEVMGDTHMINDRCPGGSGYSMSNRAGQRKDCNHTTVHY